MSGGEDSALSDEGTSAEEAPHEHTAGHGHHVRVAADGRLRATDDTCVCVGVVEEDGHVIFGRWECWNYENKVVASK